MTSVSYTEVIFECARQDSNLRPLESENYDRAV